MTKPESHAAWDDLTPEDGSNLLMHTRGIFRRLKNSFLLFAVLLALSFLARAVIYVVAEPEYTATAIVGPPSPSPINAIIAGLNGNGALSGLTRRLTGGSGGSGSNDPYQEYLQLLHSSRLASELGRSDHLLPVIFYKQWDAERGTWGAPGPLFPVISAVKRFLNLPVKDHPDTDDLKKFLDEHFALAPSTTGRGLSALMGTDYMGVSFTFKDPAQAAAVLGTILRRADNIIRQDQLRDVTARISYITSELPKVTAAEQKAALIDTLSSQEDLRIMLVADQLYAFTLVDSAHASIKPTSPMAPIPALILSVVLAVMAWFAIILLAPASSIIRKMLRLFSWG